LDKLRACSVIVGTDLSDFCRKNQTLGYELLHFKPLQNFSLDESKRRTKWYYQCPDRRVDDFFAKRHGFPQDIIDNLQKWMLDVLPSSWKTMAAARVADFVLDCLVNLFIQKNKA
jgi:hypothetical protein